MRPEYCPERVKMPDCHQSGWRDRSPTGHAKFSTVSRNAFSHPLRKEQEVLIISLDNLCRSDLNESLIGLRWIHNLPTKHLYTQRRDK